jgi:hypothetical protein
VTARNCSFVSKANDHNGLQDPHSLSFHSEPRLPPYSHLWGTSVRARGTPTARSASAPVAVCTGSNLGTITHVSASASRRPKRLMHQSSCPASPPCVAGMLASPHLFGGPEEPKAVAAVDHHEAVPMNTEGPWEWSRFMTAPSVFGP